MHLTHRAGFFVEIPPLVPQLKFSFREIRFAQHWVTVYVTVIDQQVIYLMAQLISRGKSNIHTVNWGEKPKEHNSCVLKVFFLVDLVSGKSCPDYRW